MGELDFFESFDEPETVDEPAVTLDESPITFDEPEVFDEPPITFDEPEAFDEPPITFDEPTAPFDEIINAMDSADIPSFDEEAGALDISNDADIFAGIETESLDTVGDVMDEIDVAELDFDEDISFDNNYDLPEHNTPESTVSEVSVSENANIEFGNEVSKPDSSETLPEDSMEVPEENTEVSSEQTEIGETDTVSDDITDAVSLEMLNAYNEEAEASLEQPEITDETETDLESLESTDVTGEDVNETVSGTQNDNWVNISDEAEYEEGIKTLTRDITPEVLDSRYSDTEEVLDNYRDNLREYGVEESAIEEFVSQERDKMNAEYQALDRGDLETDRYETPTDWENIAMVLNQRELEAAGIAGNTEIPQEISEAEEIAEPLENSNVDASEIDYDEIYEELDSYEFGDVDYLKDAERLDESLSSFTEESWKEMSLDGQKESMRNLAEYIEDISGLKNPPTIEFYNNAEEGDYGGFYSGSNTLRINEYMLHDSAEAADTVAHELWHAYQHERALNPQTAKDYQYQYNFDHYISPTKDANGNYVNFTEYQDQLVEAEARAFADQFKERLRAYGQND